MAKKIKKPVGQLDFKAMLDTTPLLPFIVTPSDSRYESFLTEWSRAKAFGLDIETTHSEDGKSNGLDWFRGRIRLIQIAIPNGLVLIYDCFKDNDPFFFTVLKNQLYNDRQAVVLQNGIFDLTWLKYKYGFIARRVRDTRIMSQILWCGIKTHRHGLAQIWERLTGEKTPKEEQLSDWSQPELATTQLNYAAEDAIKTLRASFMLSQRIAAYDDVPDVFGNPCKYKLSEIATIECDAIPAFVEIQLAGMPIDLEYGHQTLAAYQRVLEEFYKPVQEKIGLPYSAQPQKLAYAVYRQYGIFLLDDDGDDDDDDVEESFKEFTQLTLLGDPPPEIPPGKKISTTSANLFRHYCQTNEEDLLIISLTRSLKKSMDCIATLIQSAEQNFGCARGRYTPLGGTSTGRSTCGGDNKGTITALNMQNLARGLELKQPQLKKYGLPNPRTIIKAPPGFKLVIIDLSAAHLRYCADLSGDDMVLGTLELKDPHALMTSKMLELDGIDKDVEYCANNKNTDPDVMNRRPIAKVAFYSGLNVGGAKRLLLSLSKDFMKVALDTCKQANQSFREVFSTLSSWQRLLHKACSANLIEIKVKLKSGATYMQPYAQYRTPDGRLIHLIAYENIKTDPKTGMTHKENQPKISDCTSSTVISPEALCEKRCLKQITDLVHSARFRNHSYLINFVHDEVVLLVPEHDDELARLAYDIVAREFTFSLNGTDSNMEPASYTNGEPTYKKCLADSYDDK